jgi:quinoprotein dehydrogenase-associated probable ABC transporter substrate-binding protein
MSSRSRNALRTLGIGVLALGAASGFDAPGALRVCADPNNLPFSNERQEGFENRIAELVARDLGRVVRYTWWAQRRGFVRNTLNADLCDVIIGVPAGYDPVLTTRPYYRSTYAFVWRSDKPLGIRTFDDPRLKTLRVGVPVVGDDYAATPPAEALLRRGIVTNVIGFSVYGDYRQPNPPARLIDAVARGDIDVAIAWGPLAGYFAHRSKRLDVVPIAPESEPGVRLAFAIAMGVRRRDKALRDSLDVILVKRRAEIEGILDRYGVPRLAPAPPRAED